MNREIKFRVWSTSYNRWLHDISSEIVLYIKCEENNKLWFPEDWILQQFTGVKDSEDQEIYIGDILQYEHPKPPFTQYGQTNISEVKWVDETHDNYPGISLHHLYSQGGKCKIIGNIFETPDFIK